MYSDVDEEAASFNNFQENVETIRATCGDQELNEPPGIAKCCAMTESELEESSDEESSDEIGPPWSRASGTFSTAVAKSADETLPLPGIAKCSATHKADVPREAVLVAAGHETMPPNHVAMWDQFKTRFPNVYNEVGDEESVLFGILSQASRTFAVPAPQTFRIHVPIAQVPRPHEPRTCGFVHSSQAHECRAGKARSHEPGRICAYVQGVHRPQAWQARA